MNGTEDTIKALREALASPAPLEKATFNQPGSATVGLQDYDLSPAVLNLYPVLTPLRNMIPRVGGGFSIQANWKAVTAIDTGMISVGVSEGNRGEIIQLQTKEYLASYRTLGSEASVTDEAALAAGDFDDVRARAANTGLQALMLGEERVILGGNTSYSLNTTPTPTLAASATGGSIGAAVVVSVIAVALTLDGVRQASLTTGVRGMRTRVTPNGATEQMAGGSAIKSAAATTTVSGGTANSVTATVPVVRGAFGYAWYAGVAGTERLAAITSTNQVVITSLPSSPRQLATDLPAVDASCDQYVHDGLLTFASNPANGSYFTAAAPGAGLTADGTGGIVEFDTALQWYWDNLKLSPDMIWIASQEANWIRKKVLTGSALSASRFTFNTTQGNIVGGGNAKAYLNPFSMAGSAQEIPLGIHPNMPAGTVLFVTKNIPYQLNNIDNVLQIRTRKDYYQTEWPRRTRAYEYGVYTDQVLQCKFMPGLGVITNLSAA